MSCWLVVSSTTAWGPTPYSLQLAIESEVQLCGIDLFHFILAPGRFAAQSPTWKQPTHLPGQTNIGACVRGCCQVSLRHPAKKAPHQPNTSPQQFAATHHLHVTTLPVCQPACQPHLTTVPPNQIRPSKSNQPTSHPANLSTKHQTNQPANLLTQQPTDRPIHPPSDQPTH